MTSRTETAVRNGNRYSVISNGVKLTADGRSLITNIKGLTLVEVCLVGLILSLIFTLSWPLMNRTARQSQLDTACSEITYMFRFARDSALSEGRNYKVQFDTANRRFWLSKKDDSTADAGYISLDDSLHKARYWPEDIKLDSIYSKDIVFYPDGTCQDFEVSFKSSRGDMRTLKLQGSTGKISNQ